MGNLRFLIPTFPLFAVAGAWLLARMADRLGPPGRAATFAVAGVQVLLDDRDQRPGEKFADADLLGARVRIGPLRQQR